MTRRRARAMAVLVMIAAGCAGGPPGGPCLSIGDVTLPEGDSGVTVFPFTVTLSEVLTDDVSVDWATGSGSATAGSDFTAASGTLVITAGTTAGQIEIDVVGDIDLESDETFTVTLSNPVNAAIADGQAVGVIVCDDG